MSQAAPARVRYNDWHRVQAPDLKEFTPTLPVSVIIPYYEAPEKLALTLAALERQTYPRDLFEVVVVDDGSRTPLEAPRSTPIDVRVARQEDRGYGLARAWNLGARLARHDILVFLDGDMLAEAGMLEAHARWHHVLTDAVTLGWRKHVAVNARLNPRMVRERAGSIEELIMEQGFEWTDQADWVGKFMRDTRDLKRWNEKLFRRIIGCNFGIRRQFFELAGGMEESFTIRSRVDTEFGYRAFASGALLVPAPEALSWHLGLWEDGFSVKKEQRIFQQSVLIHRLPINSYGPPWGKAQGRVFKVPIFAVTLQMEYFPVTRALEAAEKLLAGDEYDLVVRIETRATGDELAWLKRQLGPEPRARIAPAAGALGEFPFTPFHITLPGGVDYPNDVVRRLRDRLGPRAVVADAALPGERLVSIVRCWALHRARRTGRPVAEFGERVPISSRELVAFSVPEPVVETHARRPVRSLPRLLWAGRRFVRARTRAADLGRRWFLGSRNRTLSTFSEATLRGGRRIAGRFMRRPASWNAETGCGAPPPADGALGAEIVALGPLARAVFASSSRVMRELRAGVHADVVVADARAEVADTGAPFVTLPDAPSRLLVPALDPRVDNPVDWQYRVAARVGALGPIEWLPRTVQAHQVLPPHPEKAVLHEYHHIEDTAAYHRDTLARAGELARLAANGVVVHLADGGPRLEPLLGEELHALMTSEVRDLGLDAREWLSIRMRRLALRDHSLRSRARQLCELALPDPPQLPLVSILLATRRPGLLAHALASVARQTWPRRELVLGLHGDGFDAPEVERRVRELKCPVKVVRVDPSLRLGAALNRMTEVARGAFLAKMDDDDLYDAEHIQDLMLAYEYSGARLLGKTLQFIHLRTLDETLHLRREEGEQYGHGEVLAGGSLLFPRETLEDVGGWRNVPFTVDLSLIREFESRGGVAYRTHGTGFVLVRHGAGHAWKKMDIDFQREAMAVRDGWDPEFARIDRHLSPPRIAPSVSRNVA